MKSLYDTKLGQRILIDSNVFENVWVSGQTDFAFQLTVRVAGTAAPIAVVVDDIIIQNNADCGAYSAFVPHRGQLSL